MVKLGRIVTGVAMVIGAIYAPSIAGFESLFGYFQSSLSYVVPPIIVVYILGLFVPWLNGNGAFWTIVLGLLVGVPIFIAKEVTDVWSGLGLPDIHYTIMSSIIMLAAIALHFAISAATRRPAKENIGDLVWDRQDALQIFGQWERPIWLDRTVLGAALTGSMAAVVVWLW
ncbi:hypothetical protein [Jiella mangrovi]|uniref:DUF1772 domain-containing protein n=1 Tax=Jiella mangrovi TaxID=2821407 RepID=A0ABS4BMF4_9HYPH|nr:hypothetical protein [Jiella mangrovi]MBP0617908.1 hypothetical protein [Jiella mangrovi]